MKKITNFINEIDSLDNTPVGETLKVALGIFTIVVLVLIVIALK